MKCMSKKGFTLIEMLLAIAITMIISSLFISLMVAINSSYYRTYNDVDCADIAAMYAEALENQVLYDVQNHVKDEISIDANSFLNNAGTNGLDTIHFDGIENFNRANNGPDGRKWDIRMLCTYNNTTGEFRYTFFFIDKHVNVDYLHYVYSGSFWIPTYAEFVGHTAGEGDEFVTGEVNTWDYNYTSAPHRNFTITFDYEGVDNGDDLTGASGNMTSGFHSMTTTNGVGRLEAQGTGDVSVPTRSTVIHINPVTPS